MDRNDVAVDFGRVVHSPVPYKYSLGCAQQTKSIKLEHLQGQVITDISKNKFDQTDSSGGTMSSQSTVIITTVPDFVSPEEHRNIVASTPSSFSNILPVLRHKEESVSATLDPPLDGFTPEDSTNGVLYVIESALVFMSSTGRGFQVKYPAITLHAISRGGSPSIYCQLDETDSSSPSDEAYEDLTEMRELMIVPQNPDSLEPIFEAMSLCASLHPDPNLSEEDELDGDFVSDNAFETFTGEEGEELSEVGRAALAHLESITHDPFEPEPEVNGTSDGAEEALSDQHEIKD
ncbi:regulator of volume decrease after cellular swelling-domain-containing protein [Butyriboletus roseoflavus]|nr:regulator of volume decrease after cellular swelling-domain-containing protein [Butyriboletus roseoflavus]